MNKIVILLEVLVISIIPAFLTGMLNIYNVNVFQLSLENFILTMDAPILLTLIAGYFAGVLDKKVKKKEELESSQ